MTMIQLCKKCKQGVLAHVVDDNDVFYADGNDFYADGDDDPIV